MMSVTNFRTRTEVSDFTFFEDVVFFRNVGSLNLDNFIRKKMKHRSLERKQIKVGNWSSDASDVESVAFPLALPTATKFIFLGCRNDWILFRDNHLRWTDGGSASLLAECFGTHALRVICHDGNTRSQGAYLVSEHDESWKTIGCSSLFQSGKGWSREGFGSGLAASGIKFLEAKRLSRETRRAMVTETCRKFGVLFDEPDFFDYKNENGNNKIVELPPI